MKAVKLFLILGERPTDGVNNGVGEPEKRISVSSTKSKPKFCLSLHYNGEQCHFYINRTQICRFKGLDNIPAYQF